LVFVIRKDTRFLASLDIAKVSLSVLPATTFHVFDVSGILNMRKVVPDTPNIGKVVPDMSEMGKWGTHTVPHSSHQNRAQ